MTRELKKHLKGIEREIMPMPDRHHIKKALFLAFTLFVISLVVGIFTRNLAFLCESLLIITLCWGTYRGNFSAILMLCVYLLVAKIYQLLFSTDLSLVLRMLSLFITIIFVQYFYVGFKNSTEGKRERKLFGFLDGVFVLIISLIGISVSAFAIQWYG